MNKKEKKRIIKKIIIIIAFIVAFTGTGLGLYTHIAQHRSLRSWGWEKIMQVMRVKYPENKQSEEEFAKVMEIVQEKSDELVTVPRLSSEITEENFDGMQVFIFNDKQDSEQKVLFYIHGGGYISNPTDSHFKITDELGQELDAKVVFPIYPKAPRFNYIDAFEKVEALYEKILSDTSSSDNITLMGDSAGGGFALGLSYKLRDDGIAQPKDIILVSPWLDLNMNNPDIELYQETDPLLNSWELKRLGEMWAAGKDNMNNPYASPIYGDMQGLGRITLFAGTREIFYPDIMKFDEMLTQAGIDHTTVVGENQNHVYAVMPAYRIPEAKEARRMMVEIINSYHSLQ